MEANAARFSKARVWAADRADARCRRTRVACNSRRARLTLLTSLVIATAAKAGPRTRPTTETAPTAKRTPVEAAREPLVPPAAANLGRKDGSFPMIGLTKFIMGPDRVLQMAPARKLLPVPPDDAEPGVRRALGHGMASSSQDPLVQDTPPPWKVGLDFLLFWRRGLKHFRQFRFRQLQELAQLNLPAMVVGHLFTMPGLHLFQFFLEPVQPVVSPELGGYLRQGRAAGYGQGY